MSGKSFEEKLDKALVNAAARGNARKVAELLALGSHRDLQWTVVTHFFDRHEVIHYMVEHKILKQVYKEAPKK